jgi:hypothetical protein
MQRRRWTSHRLQRLLLIGLGKEVRQLQRQWTLYHVPLASTSFL